MRIRAFAVSLAAHLALLMGALLLVHAWRHAEEPGLVVQAPLGGVFVREEAPGTEQVKNAEAPKPAPAGRAATVPAMPSPPSVGGSAEAPGSQNATPIGKIIPIYPPLSRKLGEEGEAAFWLDIRADGSVAEAKLDRSSGFERLDQAALKALRAARFENPQSIPAKKRFQVEFRLSR